MQVHKYKHTYLFYDDQCRINEGTGNLFRDAITEGCDNSKYIIIYTCVWFICTTFIFLLDNKLRRQFHILSGIKKSLDSTLLMILKLVPKIYIYTSNVRKGRFTLKVYELFNFTKIPTIIYCEIRTCRCKTKYSSSCSQL